MNEATTQPMGAFLLDKGVGFRVWAPHAEAVFISGTFNDWAEDTHALERESDGNWFIEIDRAKVGDEYRYLIHNSGTVYSRIDPYSREVTNSVGNSVVYDPRAFDWSGDTFKIAPWNELVIYELHVGTFRRSTPDSVGTFETLVEKLPYLQSLGVNAIELMPTAEFAGDISWGYNPAHIFAIESGYGGPDALKNLVKNAHQHGIAVIIDVVYNHLGPSDLDLWQFDGWSENNKGGIYFYNDWRSATPWGDSRPDYGRQEVRRFIHDNAVMWLDEFRMDGLRYDMTLFIRSIDGHEEIPEGWSLAQWVNRDLHQKFPHKITIAEDLQNNEYLTKSVEHGGAGFASQWDANFVHPVRDFIITADDSNRSMQKLIDAVLRTYNGDPFQRVIYTESHDEVANGKQRVPSEIDDEDPASRYAQKRATLGAALVLTSPGIPMLFQGQEFLRSGWFDDSRGIDWRQQEEHDGIVRLFSDLITLRKNVSGVTRGLCGAHTEIITVDEDQKLLAYQRIDKSGPGDDTIVIANCSDKTLEDYRIALPAEGE